jgi:L-aminopeptidase/D-esterase-like protein
VKPGRHNAITDVPGVSVGHHQRLEPGWATGTTVVLVPDGAVGAVDGRGGAPGTRETDLLAPANLVQQVHAVCLTGGSAYGLAAADGVMTWLAERNYGLPVGREKHEVVPIVPAAVLFDLRHGAWGNRPDAGFGYAACEAATDGAVAMGSVGAGTGAAFGSLKGGIGTASVVLDDGSVVGALVAANAAGEAVDPATGRPWAADLALAGEFDVTWPNRQVVLPDREHPLHTTIGVVAVAEELTKAQAQRLAMAGQDGLVRAARPAHLMVDGDTVFALATGARQLDGGPTALDRLCAAAADAFTRAMIHALVAAESLPGLPAYRDLWPESLSHVGRRGIRP